MTVRTIIDAIVAGDTVTAEAELNAELSIRSEALIEEGRQFIAASVQDQVGGAQE